MITSSDEPGPHLDAQDEVMIFTNRTLGDGPVDVVEYIVNRITSNEDMPKLQTSSMPQPEHHTRQNTEGQHSEQFTHVSRCEVN